MDGLYNGSKPYEQMDDLGWDTPIFGNTHMNYIHFLVEQLATDVTGHVQPVQEKYEPQNQERTALDVEP